MTLRFQPLAGFSLLCLPLFFALLGLGAWQLERLQWKLSLIADMKRGLAAAPIGLDRALALGESRAQYRSVAVTGRFEEAKQVYLFTTGPDGAPVYHVLTPLVLGAGRSLMVDRGYVPQSMLALVERPDRRGQRPIHLVGIWLAADRPGPFTPPPDLKRRIWFARDPAGIAKAEDLRLVAPTILEARRSPGSSPWPRVGQTRIDIPNDHLQYALTWFLLAAALVAVYIAYHRAQGRFGFAAQRPLRKKAG